jgi:hypothetical protein
MSTAAAWSALQRRARPCAEEFAVVHDDDDAWHPDFLATATRFLSTTANRHYVAVATACTVVRERIEEGEVREIAREDWVLGTPVVDYARMVVANQFPPICLLFRRRVVDAIGGFNGALPVLGDWEFNLRLMLLGDIGYVPRPLAYYHHRVAGTAGDYGNTVIDGSTMHAAQQVRLRNGLIRAALAGRPEAIGLLQPMLHAISQERPQPAPQRGAEFPEWRLERIERELAELRGSLGEIRMVASWQRKILQPVQWLYAGARRLVRR